MLVDANILLYARNVGDPHHEAAKQWIESALNGNRRVGLPWQSLYAFMRISTNRRAFANPLTGAQAVNQVQAWIGAPMAWIPEPTANHVTVLRDLLQESGIVGPLVSDAILAAIAYEHGLVVQSTDTDFAKFPEVRWANPL